jgi:hypothetical protein
MLHSFLNGAAFMAAGIITLFFCRFWVRTRDTFFLYFAAAFALLTLERVFIEGFHTHPEFNPYVYPVRLMAYLLILCGIIRKNRRR